MPTIMEKSAVKRSLIAAVLAGLLSTAAPAAMSATFKAAAEGNTLVVYMTSDRDRACFTDVTFSYQRDGKRVTTRYVCHIFGKAGTDVKFCSRTDDDFVDLKVESEVRANCE
jgi:hypothetical protein